MPAFRPPRAAPCACAQSSISANASFLRDARDRLDVGEPAVQVHDDDRARAWRHPLRERRGIDVQRRLVDVRIDGRRTGRADRRRGVAAGVRDRRDLVARADAERTERELERVGAVADRDARRGAAVRRELALERLDLGTEDVVAAIVDARDGGVELRAERRVVAREIVERDRHPMQPAAASAVRQAASQFERSGASASVTGCSARACGLQQK